MASSVLQRVSDRPILSPREGHWDAVSVFNPGAVDDGRTVHMLYRAVSDLGEYVSRLGYATSDDGVTFQRVVDEPVVTPMHDWDRGGVEDARIVPGLDGWLVTYAAPNKVPGPVYAERDFFARALDDPYIDRPKLDVMEPSYTGLLRTTDFRNYESLGYITPDGLDDRDGILFPRRSAGSTSCCTARRRGSARRMARTARASGWRIPTT